MRLYLSFFKIGYTGHHVRLYIKKGYFMKKLFLPVALLTMVTLRAEEQQFNDEQDTLISQEQLEFQLAETIFNQLIQEQLLKDFYISASEDQRAQFIELVRRYAHLCANVSRFHGQFNDLYKKLSELTGCVEWQTPFNFMSENLVQRIRTQQQALQNIENTQQES